MAVPTDVDSEKSEVKNKDLGGHQKTPPKSILVLATLLLGGTSLLFPAPVWIPIVLCSFVLLRKRISRSASAIVIILLLLKISGTAITSYITHSLPLKVTSQRSLALFLPPFSFFSLSEMGQVEANVASRRNLIRNPDSFILRYGWWPKTGLHSGLDFSEIDPFTGSPYKLSDRIRYSIGPDMKDQAATLIYDPTNGTFSAGDILLDLP